MEEAEHHGLVFATDPTSAWACTIGGNIAENAGGKDCVLYGTCIDNLLSWRMAMPSGRNWTIRRLDHQLRKILPDDVVTFAVFDESGAELERIALGGTEVRKKGLWKDITNKALGGVPGLQKEGCDGVITSAEFILYPEYEVKRTLCLEFFGPDFDEASRVILDLARAFPFPNAGREALEALEHFDAEYVRAINYKIKAARAETPKAVLLVDVVGHTPEQAAAGIARIRGILDRHPNTLLFEARDAAEGKKFWADRKRLGAIARRTNAFKMNEDIVLPLEALAEFARWVDDVNVEEERFAQLRFVERAEEVLGAGPRKDAPEWTAAKAPAALERCARTRAALEVAAAGTLRGLTELQALQKDLGALVSGYSDLTSDLDRVHKEVRDRLIVLATHMHAGDGNVHVNIPVLSNDRAMLHRTEEVIDRVMAKVVSLRGVVSGEHGIGVTKLKYLEPERIAELDAHRRNVDPTGMMNPGKLQDVEILDRVFTPSFNLLELEARILQHGQLEDLARSIAHCVRCGKCKPDCCVFHPARGMFFHPRNKNLAIGSLIEALLYDAQRERSTRFELLRWLEEVADHCTGCHKCLKPCPVDIDTGIVSILEREILSSWGYKRTTPMTAATLRYLDSRSPTFNKLFRTAVVRLGGAMQRAGCEITAPFQPRDRPPRSYALQVLRSPVPPAPPMTLRDVLPYCEPDQVLVFEPAAETQPHRLLLPGLRLGAAPLDHLHGCAARPERDGGPGRRPAAVPLLRLPRPVQREDRPVLADGAAGHHPLQPDPGDVQLPHLRRLPRHLRHLPRRARRDGGREALRRPHHRRRALRAGAGAAARGRRRLALPRPVPRLARGAGARGDRQAGRLREGEARAALLLGGRDALDVAPRHHRLDAAQEAHRPRRGAAAIAPAAPGS